MERSTPTTILRALALGVLIFIIASCSIALTRFEGGAAFIWPATAPLLAFLTVRPMRTWLFPIVVAGVASWLASTIFGLGPVIGIPLAVAIVGEALISAMLLRATGSAFEAFDGLPALILFVISAGVVAPALSGIVAALAISAHSGQTFWPNWWAWFAAHGLGTISFTPLLLLFLDGEGCLRAQKTGAMRKIEAAALVGVVAIVTFGVFDQERLPLLFLPLLPILVTPFRLGRLGASTSIALLAVIGSALTLKGHGPVSLLQGTSGQKAQFFQFYLAVAVLMVLPAAAELKRRNALVLRARQNEASYRLLAENASDTMIHTSLEGDVRFASPAILDLTGYRASEVIDRNSRDFVVAEDLSAFEAARAEAIADTDRTISIEYRARVKNDEIIWCETGIRSYADGNGMPAGIILIVRNVSARKAAEAELNIEARTDELTGLPNRRAFFRRLDFIREEVDTQQESGCLALLDIDFFKRVNDVHGHAAGDLVLQAVATAARGALRSGDMVARVGGEEFGLVLWGTNVEQAAATCERVREAIGNCSVRSSSGVHIIVTASLGLTSIKPGVASATMYEAADRMLYEAKKSGRNRVLAAA